MMFNMKNVKCKNKNGFCARLVECVTCLLSVINHIFKHTI